MLLGQIFFFFFFFNDTATTEIYTLSLHDALPISDALPLDGCVDAASQRDDQAHGDPPDRSEEHTSELQSQSNLVCRLLLEKKKKNLVSLVTDEQHTADILVHHMLYY